MEISAIEQLLDGHPQIYRLHHVTSGFDAFAMLEFEEVLPNCFGMCVELQVVLMGCVRSSRALMAEISALGNREPPVFLARCL